VESVLTGTVELRASALVILRHPWAVDRAAVAGENTAVSAFYAGFGRRMEAAAARHAV
jgi:hypothetical protein